MHFTVKVKLGLKISVQKQYSVTRGGGGKEPKSVTYYLNGALVKNDSKFSSHIVSQFVLYLGHVFRDQKKIYINYLNDFNLCSNFEEDLSF